MKRWGVVVTTGLLVGALGLSGCGVVDRATGGAGRAGDEVAVEVPESLGVDGMALAAMGVDTEALEEATGGEPEGAEAGGAGSATEPAAGPTATATAERDKRHRARVLMRKNLLHGDVVVRTKKGPRTVAVQRGSVESLNGTTVVVRSSDGFTQTWQLGDKVKVVKRGTAGPVPVGEIRAGAEVGLAGAREGDRVVARLVVLPQA